MNKENERREFLTTAAMVVAGVGFLGFGNTALRAIISPPFRPIPHGNAAPMKISDADGKKMSVVHTVCLGCNARCGLRARVYDNIVYKVDGNPYCMANNYWAGIGMDKPLEESFKSAGKTCLKGQEIAHYAYDPYRVVTPLKRAGKRGEGKFKPISWKQLIEESANGGTIEETGEKVVGFKLYADNYLDQHHVLESVYEYVSQSYLAQWLKAIDKESSDIKKALEDNFSALYLSKEEAAKLPNEIKQKLIDPQMPGLGPKSNMATFMYGRGTEGRSDLYHAMAYDTIGTPNMAGHADVCQWPKWAGQICAYNEPHVGPDLKSTSYVISWGAQIAEAFNPAVPTWGQMHKRKGDGELKVVWIDPRAHNGVNAYSHRHIMPKPGEDGAIAAAMLNWIMNNKKYDTKFLENPNIAAAKADNEVMFSNASHLVVIGPSNHKLYRKILRASDAGLGDSDSYVVVDKASGSLKANNASNAAYFLLDEFSGAKKVANAMYAHEDNDPNLKFPKQSRGLNVQLSDGSSVQVTTSLQLLKDFVNIQSVEEWCARAKVQASDIEKTAAEFTSYGKKACIVSYRGAVMHINGVQTAWMIEALNMLNGNIGHKGGMCGGHPKTIIFLTADAFGVLPPVSLLSKEQAMYYFLSGYTAKVAGTERGIIEPVATFSACFGEAFLPLHPTVYAELLGNKIDEHGVKVYLVNTGWSGGSYGVGKRMSIQNTRACINAILDGSILENDFDILSTFGLLIPKTLHGVDTEVLNPRNVWEDKEEYDKTAHKLAEMFIENFKKYTKVGNHYDYTNAGPKIEE